MRIEVKGVIGGLMLILVGCATGYQPQGFTGGYRDAALGDGMFSVSFNGNAMVSSTKAADMALLRSAEVAKENGFSYFVIAQTQDSSSVGSYTDPVRVNVSNYAIGSGYTVTNTTGGNTTVYSKPASRMVIKGLHEKTEHSFTADEVIRSIRASYGL